MPITGWDLGQVHAEAQDMSAAYLPACGTNKKEQNPAP